MTTAKQNQKIPFHFFFRFAVEGWGEEPDKEMQGSFWVCPRESASAVEAQSERTLRVQATTRSARAKWVRAKDNTSPQKETSESERWEEVRAEGAGVGKRARRFATNWDGTGAAKWADLSLVSYLKTI